MTSTYETMGLTIDSLLRDGWSIEMETGIRGGEVRSWVKLRHFERGKTIKRRSEPRVIYETLQAAAAEALSQD
jgi:hypothetical protein